MTEKNVLLNSDVSEENALLNLRAESDGLTFDDIRENPEILKDIDVIINVGDADTAHTGGEYWENPDIVAAIRGFVHNGGGFIGVGEPTGHQYQGHFLQLAKILGVEKETGFTLNYDKYNWEEHPENMSIKRAFEVIDALGVTIDDVIFYASNQQNVE